MATQSRYYHRNKDAQKQYDHIMENIVQRFLNMELFMEHDIRRLERLISAGGREAQEAAELSKLSNQICRVFLPT